MNLLDYKQWILLGAFVAAAFVGIKFWESRLIEEGRDEMRAEYAARTLEDTQAARKQETTWQTKKDEAQHAAVQRAQTDQAYRAATDRTIASLRKQLANANSRMSSASIGSCREYSAALSTVFESCVGEYRSMGEAAQGHATDALMLEQAWPK
jgi:hypothetical protein